MHLQLGFEDHWLAKIVEWFLDHTTDRKTPHKYQPTDTHDRYD